MRERFQSVALYTKVLDSGESRYLLLWDQAAGMWKFLTGERLEKESDRETLAREVAWQLNLDRQTDFLISAMALRTMTLPEPARVGEPAGLLHVSFFPIYSYRKSVASRLDADPRLRWVSPRDIGAGRTRDQQIIEPRVAAWIRRWEILPVWSA